MNLSTFLFADGNYSSVGWRHPDAMRDAGLSFDRWVELAKLLESAKFDMLFVADQISAPGVDQREAFCRTVTIAGFEPITLLSALSQATERLGLAATVNTTWTEPYNTARMLASLDRISDGRAGWNVVTGVNPEDALNFNKEKHVEHANRYSMAEEFVDVCRSLWDSFDDDAFVLDKESGQVVDPKKMHVPNHAGTYFSVRGPLNVPRPRQGHPVIIQAGMSEAAREMAARVADCLFVAQSDMAEAQVLYADVKGRMAKHDRHKDSLRILPGVSVYVGKTQEEAEAKFELLQSKSSIDLAIRQVGAIYRMDFSQYPLEGPIPRLNPSAAHADPEGRVRAARAQNLTLRQWLLRYSAARTHLLLISTPEGVANELETWFCSGAADGFNLLPPHVPGSIQDFVEMVVPILQKRGLFRHDYNGRTLRDHLGLERPADKGARLSALG